MHKKLITACVVIAAFAAFVVAPSASAATLTEGGVAIAVGSSITGSAGETRITAGNNTVTCTEVRMSGTLTANANGTVAAEIAAGNPVFSGIGGGGDCESVGLGATKVVMNSKLCLHVAKGTDEGTITGCGGAVVTFTLKATNLGMECHYERAVYNAEFTTAPADAAVKIVPGQLAKREGTNLLCPAENEFDMEVTLTTTSGATLTVS